MAPLCAEQERVKGNLISQAALDSFLSLDIFLPRETVLKKELSVRKRFLKQLEKELH